ncbi:MAG: RsmB/NOP family class I SAM-dependent RNA methyltransferase [Candidatus Kryptoniota bacterium]
MKTSSLAGHAVELISLILKSKLPADKVIADYYKLHRYLGSHDRRWISEKVFSIIRNMILLMHLSQKCTDFNRSLALFLSHEIAVSGFNFTEIEHDYDDLISAYRTTASKIDLPAVEKCINDAMVQILAEPKKYQNLIYSFMEGFQFLLPEHIQNEAENLMFSLNTQAPMVLRINNPSESVLKVIEFLKAAGIESEPAPYSPIGIIIRKRTNLSNLELFKNGGIEVQDEASQIVGMLLFPLDGEIVVDACAGGGGKSLEAAAFSNGKGEIYSLDIDTNRLENMQKRIKRGKFTNINTILVKPDSYAGIEHLINNADKVLVDAPCTGSGTIRRNPDKKFKISVKDVEQASIRQFEILKHYSELVKRGGTLFYATCSIFDKENADVVSKFLASNRSFEPVSIKEFLKIERIDELIHDDFLEIYPHRHAMDGFFAAAMRRVR